MKLEDYFSQAAGVGVMSTADAQGAVNSAIYATPHFLEDGLLSFIARDRLTRKNLTENPSAQYLFVEHTEGYKGLRLYLEKVAESQDETRIAKLSRRPAIRPETGKPQRYLISFRVKKILALLGPEELDYVI